MKELENRVKGLENTMLALIKHTREVNTSIATGFEKIDANFLIVNRRIDALRGDVDALRGDVDTLRGDVGELRGDVGELRVNVGELRGDVGELRGDVDALRGNSTSSLETIENKLTDLTVEVSKINEVTSYEGVFNNTLKIKK